MLEALNTVKAAEAKADAIREQGAKDARDILEAAKAEAEAYLKKEAAAAAKKAEAVHEKATEDSAYLLRDAEKMANLETETVSDQTANTREAATRFVTERIMGE